VEWRQCRCHGLDTDDTRAFVGGDKAVVNSTRKGRLKAVNTPCKAIQSREHIRTNMHTGKGRILSKIEIDVSFSQ
jgi:hypothetical protein